MSKLVNAQEEQNAIDESIENEKDGTTLFAEQVDYLKPSEDRPLQWKVGKQILYLNQQQFNFLKAPYDAEKKRREREGKCTVSDGKGKTKRCDKPWSECQNCPFYKSGKTNGGVVSLDKIYDEYEYNIIANGTDIVERLITEERDRKIHEVVDSLPKIDSIIINNFMNSKSEEETILQTGLCRKTIYNRRKALFALLSTLLKEFQD